MHAHRQRLGERSEFGGQTAGHLDAHHLVEHHELGIAAVVGVAKTDAVQPGVIERNGHRHDHVADGKVADALAEFDHLAAEFVTHHHVLLGHEHLHRYRLGCEALVERFCEGALLASVGKEMEIAAADATRQNLREYLADTGTWCRDVVDSELPITNYGCTHGARVTRLLSG